jgi:hypothetical protein
MVDPEEPASFQRVHLIGSRQAVLAGAVMTSRLLSPKPDTIANRFHAVSPYSFS